MKLETREIASSTSRGRTWRSKSSPLGCVPQSRRRKGSLIIADFDHFADIVHPEFKPGSKKVVRQGWVESCTRRHAKMGTEGWQVKLVLDREWVRQSSIQGKMVPHGDYALAARSGWFEKVIPEGSTVRGASCVTDPGPSTRKTAKKRKPPRKVKRKSHLVDHQDGFDKGEKKIRPFTKERGTSLGGPTKKARVAAKQAAQAIQSIQWQPEQKPTQAEQEDEIMLDHRTEVEEADMADYDILVDALHRWLVNRDKGSSKKLTQVSKGSMKSKKTAYHSSPTCSASTRCS